MKQENEKAPSSGLVFVLLPCLAPMLGGLEWVQDFVIKVTLLITVSHSFVDVIGTEDKSFNVCVCVCMCSTETAFTGLCV